MDIQKLKSEFFQAALASTVVFLIVVVIPWIWDEETDFFHIMGLVIIIGLWTTYLFLKWRETYGLVSVVIENVESVLLEEILSNSRINATIKNARHLSNMQNWEIEMTQKDYEKLSEYMSKYPNRYRGRIHKKEE